MREKSQINEYSDSNANSSVEALVVVSVDHNIDQFLCNSMWSFLEENFTLFLNNYIMVFWTQIGGLAFS